MRFRAGAKVLCAAIPAPDTRPKLFEPTVIAVWISSMSYSGRDLRPDTCSPKLCATRDRIAPRKRFPFALAASVWTGNTQRGEAIRQAPARGRGDGERRHQFTLRLRKRHTAAAARAAGAARTQAGLLEMVQTKYIDMDRLPRREKPWWYRYGADLERARRCFLQFEFSAGIAAKLATRGAH